MMPIEDIAVKYKNTSNKVIKIKSPKSDIKVHKLDYFVTTKTSPELTIRGPSTHNRPPNDDVDKITQAWNRLKINTLSKAIAIAAEVDGCTIGPKVQQTDKEDSEPDDEVDGEKLDLSKIVTSTPVKSKSRVELDRSVSTTFNANKSNSFDISEVTQYEENNCSSRKNNCSELESMKMICLNLMEAKRNRSVLNKQYDYFKVLQEHDEKIKEASVALKKEMEKERLVRIKELYIDAQQFIMKSSAEAESNAQEQLEQQQKKLDQDKRLAETGDKIRQIELKKKEIEAKQKQKREELKRYIDGVYQLQMAYGQKYYQINELTKSCKDIRRLYDMVSNELHKLKGLNESLVKVVDKCKLGKVSLHDLKSAERLVEQVTSISAIFSQQINEINKSVEKAEEDKRNEELIQEVKAKTEEAERQQKAKAEIEKSEKGQLKETQRSDKLLSGIEDCISGECLKWQLELSNYLEEYERKLIPLRSNDSLKKFRFDCQKAVNVPVNAISPLDDLHLEDKFYKLNRLLQGQATPVESSLFLATGHPLGIPYCKNVLAKKFVKQGEHTVSSKPEAAFAIAAVIVALWVEYPEFGRLLMAHFQSECPYLIPAFLPQVEGQSNENYYRMLGYQYSEDGKVETQDKFLRRMSGVMRLYAAVLITPLKRSHQSAGKTHPLNIAEGWRWITATLNLSPRPDISPTMIYDFLDVAGEAMFRTYGAQFRKLLQYLCTDYFSMIEQVTPEGCGGPVVRLKSFLEKILIEGRVPPPAGLLPPNFW